MPDMEKVIKGITHHKLGQCDMSGKICPYWVEDDHCSKKMLEDALALLKEQQEQLEELEPPRKWIICKACGHKLRNDWLWCPWCRWEIRQGYNADELI